MKIVIMGIVCVGIGAVSCLIAGVCAIHSALTYLHTD